MNEEKARKELRSILTKLSFSKPYLGIPASKLGYVYVEANDQVAFTDGKNVYLTPVFFTNYNTKEKMYIIAHELLHVAFDHMARSGSSMDPRIANIAADAVVNYLLDYDMMTRPKDVAVKMFKIENEFVIKYSKTELGRASANEFWVIYKAIEPEARSLVGDMQSRIEIQARQSETNRGSNMGGSGGQRSKLRLGPAVAGEEFRKARGKVLKKPAPDIENARSQKEVGKIIRNSMRQVGVENGEIQQYLQAMDKSQVNWKTLLRRWLDAYDRGRLSWSWPSLTAPKWKGKVKKPSKIVVFVLVDSSGSVSDREFVQFLSEIKAIVKNKAKVVYGVFDVRIAELGKMEKSSIVRLPRTYGGTDPAKAVREAKKEIMKELRNARARISVLFSDLWFDYPAELDRELSELGFVHKIAVATHDHKKPVAEKLKELGWIVLPFES
ncbi:MAG: hypothetical protein DRP47_10025 [Candidatus Zixiibacteriota bacterium]|nr:MAG: hypothetical protein DRP47_10025 [candidate division Zixibacteria bacterium]